jgi:hypothetical protein
MGFQISGFISAVMLDNGTVPCQGRAGMLSLRNTRRFSQRAFGLPDVWCSAVPPDTSSMYTHILF